MKNVSLHKTLLFLTLFTANIWALSKKAPTTPSNPPQSTSSSSASTSSVASSSSSSSSLSSSSSSVSSQSTSASSTSSTSSDNEFSYVDPTHLIPAIPLQIALNYYQANKSTIENTNYLTIVDFTQYANNKRMYLIDMRTGDVTQYLVAHGSGSDPNHTGYATSFSNIDGSHQSSLGFYKTDTTYTGDDGYSLILEGLSPSDSAAEERGILVHGATYVDPSYNPLGRSWGCFAMEMSEYAGVINMIQGGSIIYAYQAQLSTEKP